MYETPDHDVIASKIAKRALQQRIHKTLNNIPLDRLTEPQVQCLVKLRDEFSAADGAARPLTPLEINTLQTAMGETR